MHGHADKVLRDENRAVAQWLVSKYERRRQSAENHDFPLVVAGLHLEECIDVGGTRRERVIQSALAEFLLNLRQNRIRIADDERIAFRLRDIDRHARRAFFVASVGESGVRKMLVPFQRFTESGIHDEIVFLRDKRINMAGGAGERQLGLIQKRHDVKNVIFIAPTVRHLASGFIDNAGGLWNAVFERHDAVGVKAEVAFQNEDGLDLALEDVRLAFDGREELEIVREREIAILAVRQMAVTSAHAMAEQINAQLVNRVDSFRQMADGQPVDGQRAADERPAMAQQLVEGIEEAQFHLRTSWMRDDRAADGLLQQAEPGVLFQ